MSVNGSSLLNLLVYLIIIVIFVVVLLWILDRFLVIDGGILLYNADSEIAKSTNTFCNEIVIPQEDKSHGDVICKLM